MSDTWTILKARIKAYTDTLYDLSGTAAGKIASSISDGDLTHAPDGNSVFDALAGKPAFNNVLNSVLVDVTDYHIPYKLSGEPNIGMLSSGMSSDGTHTTIIDGNLVIGTAGHGISFAATTQAAGMTGELFDDYEIGTWTPAFNLTSGSVTYANQTGLYTKIGRIVHWSFRIALSGRSTPVNTALTITLPFTKTSTNDGAISIGMGYLCTLTGSLFGFISSGLSTLELKDGYTGTDVNVSASTFLSNNNCEIYMAGSFTI